MPRLYDHGGNIFAVARSLGLPPEEISDFSASINPLGFSPNVRGALAAALDSLIHYPESSHSGLKDALAKHHNLPAECFAIANGSTELIYNIPAMLPGRKALLISPSFSEYAKSLEQRQWEVRHFKLSPENGFAIDTDKLEPALTDGFDAFYLCNPGNPGGTLYDLQTVERIYRLCADANVFFILDEAFMDFCESGSAREFIVRSENAVLLRSMTKFFGIPGLRLGYSISHPALALRFGSMGGPWNVSTLALVAGVAALQDTEHNRMTLEFIASERKTLFEKLKEFPFFRVFPSSANYLLVEILSGMDAVELKKRMLERHILIRDCSSFVGLSDRFFRVAVRSVEENRLLLECLGEIMG